MMKVAISSIGTATPPHRVSQSCIADFMAKAHQFEGDRKKRLKALYRATGIQYRYSVLKDYGNTPENFEFYSKSSDMEPFPTTSQRNEVYRKEALSLASQAVVKCLNGMDQNKLTHLITVSCTGLYAPGLDIELIQKLNLPPDIQRTAINFMGCYAAFNAIKIGQYICQAQPQSQVLIVCLELCSIHFQKQPLEDYILSNALFGDGAAALLMNTQNCANTLDLVATHGEVLVEGSTDMAWNVGNLGFEMRLSRYVPDLISDGIEKLTNTLMHKGSWKLSDIDYFAIHPGGRKILEYVQKALNITRDQNRFSNQILREFGNMSSPTILFVLKEIWDNLNQQDHDKKILCFAFGPGLTMESMVLAVNQPS